MITIWIPSQPQRSYAYRRGDAQIIHDDDGNAIIIDGGEDEICEQIISYCKSHGITHVTYILSHWHPDHDRGMKLILESSIIVDKIYCPPTSDLKKLRDSSDYPRAEERMSQARRLGKTIINPPADQVTSIQVGKIKCDIWRRSPNSSESYDYQVNNTSMVCYFPDLFYMTSGDTINSLVTYLKHKYGRIVVFKIAHHGNACTSDATNLLAELGAKLCWYNHCEAYGVGIGGDGFSKWGAAYCKRKGFAVLRPFHAITMTAAAKKLTVYQNGSKWSFDIPYEGEAYEGWIKGKKWWYQYKDGSWAVGWAKLPWSQGENWFYFDPNGYMVTGWIKVNGYWYYLDENGAMVTGWLEYKGKKCYLEPEENKNQGHAYCNETRTIDGKEYTFDSNCYLTENNVIPSSKPDIKQNPYFKGYNVSKRTDPIMYIVIHYVGAEGTAEENMKYFSSANRNASADFFVGHNGEIYQYNPNPKQYYSWHCGGGRQSSKGGSLYGKCKNGNSIGIELCCKKVNGEWTFSNATVISARNLVKFLMEEYGVRKICRHFDVNGKSCPNVKNWLEPSSEWDAFVSSLGQEIYRVRKSWEDVQSQIGAFKDLTNAKNFASQHEGYSVFDSSGNKM